MLARSAKGQGPPSIFKMFDFDKARSELDRLFEQLGQVSAPSERRVIFSKMVKILKELDAILEKNSKSSHLPNPW